MFRDSRYSKEVFVACLGAAAALLRAVNARLAYVRTLVRRVQVTGLSSSFKDTAS